MKKLVRGASVAAGVFFMLGASGCSTTTRVYGQTTTSIPKPVGAPCSSEYRVQAASSRKDTLDVQLSATQCRNEFTTRAETPYRDEKKATFFGGPGLIIGGVALGAVGGVAIASARDQPETCPPGDDQCVSKEQATALGIVAGGLGLAGLIVGTYNTFKGPRLIKSDVSYGPIESKIEYQSLPIASVPLSLWVNGREIGRQSTDGAGRVAWSIPDATLVAWSKANLQILAEESLTFQIDGRPLAQAAFAREVERMQALLAQIRADLDRRFPEPDPGLVIPPPPPMSSSPSVDRDGMVYRARRRLYTLIHDYPAQCRTIVQFVPNLLLVLGGEKLEAAAVERVLDALFRERSWIRSLVGAGMERFLTEVLPLLLEDVTAALNRLADRTADDVCNVVRDVLGEPPP